MYFRKMLLLIGFISVAAGTALAQTDEFHLNKSYEINSNGTVLLKSDDADVTIVGSNRNDVHVVVDYKLDTSGFSFGHYEPFKMKVWTENGNLYIKEKPRDMTRFVIGDTDEKYTILIEAPKSVSLKLRGDDENYKINKINGELRINADDASVFLTSCNGNYFAIRLDDGTVNMNSGHGKLYLDVDDGNATIKNGAFNTIRLNADDGNFTIHNTVSNNGEYDFDIDDGSINFYLNASGNGETQLELNTDDGNIAIHTDLRNDDQYYFDTDDANIEFYAESGGGTFIIHHDDADISSGAAYHILKDNESLSKYRLGDGNATISMSTDDADIDLRR